MKILTALISLPDGKIIQAIRKPSEIHIETSFKELVARAEIKFARNVEFFYKYQVRDVFKHGTPITIAFGYDGELVEEFTGYISEVSADFPVIVKCQDEMWKLRRMPVNYSSNSVTLEKMLKDICKGYTINALEGVNLGSVRFAKTNVGEVLDKLSSDFNIYTYMDGKTVVSGKYYSDNTNDPVYQVNLDTYIAENNLEYRSAEDILLKIKGKSVGIKGGKVEFEIGETGGDELSLSYFNIKTQAELKKLVELDYNRRKRGGYTGTVTTFGTPWFKHGRKIELVSNLFPERAGVYYIDSVVKHFQPSGIRQELTLGGKAA
ncbi:MAG: hypothetical protein K1X81_01855 [Bacteroidia bacterium]|nr:hypothetical protein [Bacteroidia bacterium]